MQNAQFVDCMVKCWYYFSAINTQFTNCYVEIKSNYCTDETHVSFSNSIVRFGTPNNLNGTVGGLSAINSILYHEYSRSISTSSSSFYNCISIKTNNLFDNQTNTTNMTMNNFGDVFETYDGSYIAFYDPIYERFILKSSFATSFLGNDGTEVGIHGGQAPYNPRPNYMVLKQCNVANQSTVDGRLSVEIQVVAEGE